MKTEAAQVTLTDTNLIVNRILETAYSENDTSNLMDIFEFMARTLHDSSRECAESLIPIAVQGSVTV